MATINWTDEAIQWLRDIHSYIAMENPSAANKVIDGIVKKVEILQDFLHIGSKYDRYKHRNIRILYYGHYRIGYLIKENNEIDILGVFHGALDIEGYIV